MRLIIGCESDSGREDEKRGGAVRERDVSGSDSSASERDEQDETRAELTARSQLQCEAVNTHNTLICLSKQIYQLITEFSDRESTGASPPTVNEN